MAAMRFEQVQRFIAGPREARKPNLNIDQRIERARQVYNRDTETGS